MFISYLLTDPFFYFSWLLVVMFSISVHEFAHAHVAYRAGDDTAWMLGHYSFNPWVQMGPQSLAMMALFGIGWGAVPVSYTRLRTRLARAGVAFAGPAANLLLLFVFAGVYVGVARWGGSETPSVLARFARIGAHANSLLFLLNMLPIPILDGWEVLGLFWQRLPALTLKRAQQISWIVLLALFLTPLGELLWLGAFRLQQSVIELWGRALMLW